MKISNRAFAMFWFAIITIFIVLSLISCSSEKRFKHMLKKHPEYLPITSLIVKDSLITKDSLILYHDTVKIKGEDIKIHDTIPCPQLVYHRSVTKNNLTATVDINKGVINIDCKADSLQDVINHMAHQITIKQFHTSASTQTIEIHRASWFDKFCYWYFGITLLLLIIYILLKYFKITTRI